LKHGSQEAAIRRFFYPFAWDLNNSPTPLRPCLPLQQESESIVKRRLTSCTGRLLEHAGLLKPRNEAPADRRLSLWRATDTLVSFYRGLASFCHIKPVRSPRSPDPNYLTRRSKHCNFTAGPISCRGCFLRSFLFRWTDFYTVPLSLIHRCTSASSTDPDRFSLRESTTIQARLHQTSTDRHLLARGFRTSLVALTRAESAVNLASFPAFSVALSVFNYTVKPKHQNTSVSAVLRLEASHSVAVSSVIHSVILISATLSHLRSPVCQTGVWTRFSRDRQRPGSATSCAISFAVLGICWCLRGNRLKATCEQRTYSSG
jgi:hypothetical protein